MTPLALALAAALAAAPPKLPQAGRDVPVEIAESGEISFEPGTGRWFLSGGAVVKRGEVTLRAASARYDPATGEVEASGGVLLTEPGRALSAASLHAVLDGPFEARDVVAFVKDGPLDLAKCRTLDEVEDAGRNRVSFGGAEVSGREGDPRIAVRGARVTLCDCGGGPPSWEIRASSADVVPGKRAWLRWPVFWVTPRFLLVNRPVPVLALPVMYVPLADRQSGLLLPGLDVGGRSRFAFSLPLYLAPAEWWDATVSYDQAFGKPVGSPASRSVRGAGSTVELRMAPTGDVESRLRVSWLRDVARDAPGANPHGDRVSLLLRHDQRWGADTALRADVGVVGDALYTTDFALDALLRAAEYRRSSVWLARRLDDGLLAVEAGYHQPLQNATAVPFGAFGADVPVLHRLPALTATLLPVRLAGPLALEAEASVARFAPVHGRLGDEGADGVGPGGRGWGGGDAGERDGAWQPGERLAATRAALRAELRAPLTLGEWAALEPWATGFLAGYAFDTGTGPRADARASGGAALSTTLARRFGALRHELTPRLEWRAGTGRHGASLPVPAYDELDGRGALAPGQANATLQKALAATPAAGFQQASLSLRNRLHAGPATVADLTLGQDVDLDRGRLAEAFADLRLTAGLLSASGEARFHPDGGPTPGVRASGVDVFSFLRGNVAVSDRRGDQLRATFISMGPSGSERLAAGLEPLLDPAAVAVAPVAFGTAGGTLRWSGATLGYDAYFNARDIVNNGTRAPSVDPATGREYGLCPGKTAAPHVYQHAATLAWESPCKCFRVAVRATLNECLPNPTFGFQFGLGESSGSRFGP